MFLGWDDDDRDKAVAWTVRERDRCPGCGNQLSETTDFDLRMEWEVEKVPCHACRMRHAKGEHVEPGEFVVVSRKDA